MAKSTIIKRILGENLSEPKPIKKINRMVTDYSVCPHCNEVIHEKGLGYRKEDDVHFHTACGGAVELPPPTDEQIEFLRRDWGIQYDKKTRKFTALVSKDVKSTS